MDVRRSEPVAWRVPDGNQCVPADVYVRRCGNRTLKNVDAVRTTYAYDAANQLKYGQAVAGRTTYVYDATGNQRIEQPPTGNRTTTTWNYENQPTQYLLPAGSPVTMSYNGDNRRVISQQGATSTKFVWDATTDAYLSELDGANAVQAVYTNEPQHYGSVVSQRRSSTSHWLHADALGTTRLLTEQHADDDGHLPASTPGATRSPAADTTVNPFRWVGRYGYYQDASTGLVYVRARMYQPIVARWTNVILQNVAVGRFRNAYGQNQPLTTLSGNGWAPILPRVAATLGMQQSTTQLPFKMELTRVDDHRGGCGELSFATWRIDLPNGVPCDGWVIQEVHFNVLLDHQCNPCERSLHDGCSLTYLEAWRVEQGRRPVFVDISGFDTFGAIALNNRKGTVKVRGYFYLACEWPKALNHNDPDGRISLVPIGWTPQNAGWKPGVQGDPPCNITSGDLLAKPYENHQPMPQRPAKPDSSVRDADHRFKLEWNCCSQQSTAMVYSPK